MTTTKTHKMPPYISSKTWEAPRSKIDLKDVTYTVFQLLSLKCWCTPHLEWMQWLSETQTALLWSSRNVLLSRNHHLNLFYMYQKPYIYLYM